MKGNKERFFQLDYDEVYYIFDNEKLTHSIDTEAFSSYDESLSGEEVVDTLNKQNKIIKELNKEISIVNECYQSYRDTVEDIFLEYISLFNQDQICKIENELFIDLTSHTNWNG